MSDIVEEMGGYLGDGSEFAETPNPNTTDSELDGFLKTLKVHNKDLDACFNDAVAVAHLKALIASKVEEARIDELKQIEPPEQYEEYAKLLGRDACNICGFNAVKFREYIQERIAALQSREQDEV